MFVPDKCSFCARLHDGSYCLALTDAAMRDVARTGQCWAYTDDEHWLEEYNRAVALYAARKHDRQLSA